jgi:hypothetical protein
MEKESLPQMYRVAITFSLIVNVILVLVVIALPFILRPILRDVMTELDNLENAVIDTTVEIDQGMPVEGVTIKVQQPIRVTTVEESNIEAAYVTMYLGGGSQVAGTTYINMPIGTELPIDFLDDIVMKSTIPVRLSVPVSIPLNETPLADSFAKFKEMLAPVAKILMIK